MAQTTKERPDVAQEEFDNIVNRNFSPEEKSRLKQQANQEESQKSSELDRLAKAESNPNWKTSVSGIPNKLQVNAKSKKGLLAGFGLGGSALILILGSFFNIFAFKIPFTINPFNKNAGSRLERVIKNRTQRSISSYGMQGSKAAVANGAEAKGYKGKVFKNMRDNGFDEYLKQAGVEFRQGEDGGIQLVYRNQLIGTAKSEAQMDKLISENRQISSVFKNEITDNTWRFFQRYDLANKIRERFNIKRFGLKNSQAATVEERKTEMVQKYRQGIYENLLDRFFKSVGCFMGSGCEVKELGGTDPGLEESISKAGENAQINGVKETLQTTATEMAKEPLGSGTPFSTKLLSVILGAAGATVATKAIPIIGWIDLAATIDHVSYNAISNDYLTKVPAYFKSQSYAFMAGAWAGISGQVSAGQMEPEVMDEFANMLNGSEESRAANYIDGHPNSGQPMSESEKVNENQTSLAKETWNTTRFVPGAPGNDYGHVILNAYYETLGEGGLLGLVGDILDPLFAWLTPDFLNEWMIAFLQDHLPKILQIIGWVADPSLVGIPLANAVHAGFTVINETTCREDYGCEKLTPQEAARQAYQEHEQKQAYFASLPLFERLFSTKNDDSLLASTVRKLPSSTSSGVTSLAYSAFSLVKKIPDNLAILAFKKADAQEEQQFTWVDLYGVDPYGGTDASLSQPLAPEMETDDPQCPESNGTFFNNCIASKTALDALNCTVVQCADPTIAP